MSYSTLLDELVALVHTVWTDVPTNSVFTAYEALRENIIEGKAASTLALPAVVIDAGQRVPEQSLSVDTDFQRLPLTIWYITTQKTLATASISTGAQIYVAYKGNQLARYMRSHLGTTFQLMEMPMVDASVSDSFNAKVAIESKTEFIACSVSFHPGLIIDATL